MMQWSRVQLVAKCALCGHSLRDGEPIFVVTTPRTKRAFNYCADCKGPAPPDLPLTRAPLQRGTKRMLPVGKIVLPFDWKQKQSGEREPGMEG